MLAVVPVPAFEDNYIWLIHNGRHAVAVDPGEAEPVRNFLRREGLTLAAILATHHHGDHTGGIGDLLQDRAVPVYGTVRGPLATHATPVAEGDTVNVPELPATFGVLAFPGHTRDHVGFTLPGALFCGDTLFGIGCGRLFEGTPEQALSSLRKILALPDDTLIYCAHEYTLENIRFAKKVEPANPDLLQWEAEVQALRKDGRPTVPTTLALEKSANPFLRFEAPDVARAASAHVGHPLNAPVEVFAAVRAWRDEA
ncbi:MAG: hydroxyacylglutathione hydrolase [Sulfuricellaceae bacterium]|jgi:hydroxyacylglutathione hydrolase